MAGDQTRGTRWRLSIFKAMPQMAVRSPVTAEVTRMRCRQIFSEPRERAMRKAQKRPVIRSMPQNEASWSMEPGAAGAISVK
jgi:hypothetical protein